MQDISICLRSIVLDWMLLSNHRLCRRSLRFTRGPTGHRLLARHTSITTSEATMNSSSKTKCSYCQSQHDPCLLMDHMLQCASRPVHLRSIRGKMEVFIASQATLLRAQHRTARAAALESGSFQPKPSPLKSTNGPPRRRRPRPTTSSGASGKSAKWRAEHEAFQAAMRAARAGSKATGPLEVNPHQHVGLIPCPHCGRTFSQTAADRHIPRCATTYNKPKPPPQMRGNTPQRPHTSHGSSGGRRSRAAPAASKWGSPSKFRDTSAMPSGGPASSSISSRGSSIPQARGASRGGGRPMPPAGGGGGITSNNTSMDNPLATSYYQVAGHPGTSPRRR